MAKDSASYLCQHCLARFSTWMGRCPNCQNWNTIISVSNDLEISAEPAEVSQLSSLPAVEINRIKTNLADFDRVLGADDPGIVIGSLVLLSGQPGIGKSTLLTQIAAEVKNSLYVSAEESLQQLKIRCSRLGPKALAIKASSERSLSKILSYCQKERPDLLIIDSIQTIYDDTQPGTPGSILQVREATWRLQNFAKSTNTACVIVGHVTKDGAIAGPKILEHLVDVVINLEGETRSGLRILRSDKNRYGSTDELGVFELSSKGFRSVNDPGRFFASLIGDNIPGRGLAITIEGSRAFLKLSLVIPSDWLPVLI